MIHRNYAVDNDLAKIHSLDYELRPDNTLIIQHTILEYPDNKIVGEDSVALEPRLAERARQSLWRLRPTTFESLEGLGWPVLPLKCERQGLHDMGEQQVFFIDERGTPELEDDLIAQFELPHPNSCANQHVTEAKQLIASVVRSFPTSSVASSFPR